VDDVLTTCRAFETSWKQSTPRRKHKISENQFDGWIAQYQLWNIEIDHPIVVEDSTIPLDKVEVRLQYERFQKQINSLNKAVGSQTSRKELALHFPTSIGHDLNTITILRTVFKRGQSIVPNTATSDTPASSWCSILMPIIHTVDSTLLQGPSTTSQLNKTEPIREGESFEYGYDTLLKFDKTPAFRMITFHNYVLYQSVEGSEVLTQDEDGAATIAVYLLTNAKSPPDTRIVGCIEGNGNQGSIHHCVFHPRLPLLAFHYRSTTGISRIILWVFARGTDPDTSSFILLNQSVLQQEGFFTANISSVQGRLRYIQFSACGTQIIYQPHLSSNPHTKPIDGLHVYESAMQQQAAFQMCENQLPLSYLHPESQILKNSNTLPQSMSLNQPVLHENGCSTRLSFNPEAVNRDIKLVHSNGEVAEEQSLLSLPAWKDVKNISVSVRMPSKSREDKVTIILNKTAQAFYSIRHGAEHTPPTVVRKDIRAIQKPKINSASSIGKTDPGWRGIGYYEKNEGCGESHRSKRARISDSLEIDQNSRS
jgi:hypothetical protein